MRSSPSLDGSPKQSRSPGWALIATLPASATAWGLAWAEHTERGETLGTLVEAAGLACSLTFGLMVLLSSALGGVHLLQGGDPPQGGAGRRLAGGADQAACLFGALALATAVGWSWLVAGLPWTWSHWATTQLLGTLLSAAAVIVRLSLPDTPAERRFLAALRLCVGLDLPLIWTSVSAWVPRTELAALPHHRELDWSVSTGSPLVFMAQLSLIACGAALVAAVARGRRTQEAPTDDGGQTREPPEPEA